MARKRIKFNVLSQSSIMTAKKELLLYRNSLQNKCEILVARLLEEGIIVARQDLGEYGKYVSFSMSTSPEQYGCKGILLATNTGIIHSEWRTQDGVKSADVSPLLMMEFGSGHKAQNPLGVPGMGQGTFPGQTHAFDSNGWWYMDLSGEWHHSYGMTPKMPMYKATINMKKRIISIAKEVFR